MKKKIQKTMVKCCLLLATWCTTAQEDIKLIGFSSNGSQITDLVKWNAGSTSFSQTNEANFVGVLVGSSVYNSKNGEYYSRIIINENNDYVSKMFQYNSQTNTTSLTNVTSVYNGSAEVDMQTGLLYSYDGDLDNNLYLNRYDPITQTSTNLGYYNFNEDVFFFPDASCYDSDAGIYYFIIQGNEGKKLVKSTITDSGFSQTIIPLTGTEVTGNIGLEYSNEQNTIHLIYPEYNSTEGTTTMKVGNLNPETGEVTGILSIAEISGLQLFNRTYDQNSEKLLFIGIDLENQQRLYAYDTTTSTLENLPLPETLLLEIEADNFEYAQARYNALGVNQNTISAFSVSPNPASDFIQVNFDGSNCNFEIADLTGKTIANGSIQNGERLGLENLSKGVYILNLNSDNTTESKKIVIQ